MPAIFTRYSMFRTFTNKKWRHTLDQSFSGNKLFPVHFYQYNEGILSHLSLLLCVWYCPVYLDRPLVLVAFQYVEKWFLRFSLHWILMDNIHSDTCGALFDAMMKESSHICLCYYVFGTVQFTWIGP
jgi:hypothetical protein